MASARTIPGSAYVSEAADSNIMAAFECFRTLRYAVAVPAMIQMIQVTMASMNFVGSCIINLTEAFRIWLYQWFKIRGVHLTTNNTGSIYWGVEKEA